MGGKTDQQERNNKSVLEGAMVRSVWVCLGLFGSATGADQPEERPTTKEITSRPTRGAKKLPAPNERTNHNRRTMIPLTHQPDQPTRRTTDRRTKEITGADQPAASGPLKRGVTTTNNKRLSLDSLF